MHPGQPEGDLDAPAPRSACDERVTRRVGTRRPPRPARADSPSAVRTSSCARPAAAAPAAPGAARRPAGTASRRPAPVRPGGRPPAAARWRRSCGSSGSAPRSCTGGARHAGLREDLRPLPGRPACRSTAPSVVASAAPVGDPPGVGAPGLRRRRARRRRTARRTARRCRPRRTSGRSAHGTGPYGAMLGWSLPVKVGTTPPTSAFAGLVDQHRDGRLEQADLDPQRPRAPAARPAAPTAAYRPVTTSATATPTLVGSVGAGDRHQPLRACAITS